ncbi:MAG: GyrI-like domain-containing protein, partial [Candidatus Helarchaeales archaeon]
MSSKLKKIDYKKQFPILYNASAKEVVIVEVPNMTFFMIDGEGAPEISETFQDAISCLYGASFTLKMKIVKKSNARRDYVVPPLEALWWMKDQSGWDMTRRDKWCWTIMMRIPDHVTQDEINRAISILKETKNPPLIEQLRVKEFHEGKSIQILHVGPYGKEPE